MYKSSVLILISMTALLTAACSSPTGTPPDAGGTTEQLPDPVAPEDPRSEIPGELFSLGFDTIRPVYAPEFTTVVAAPLQDDELVIGIKLEGEARAYPITVLRFREMVNDELAGIPILVTW